MAPERAPISRPTPAQILINSCLPLASIPADAKMSKITVANLKEKYGFNTSQLTEFKVQFDAFDEDGGGSIESKELKNVLEKCGMVVTDAQVAEMITEFDTDGSGALDFQEFITMMHRLTSGPTEKEIRKTMFEVRRIAAKPVLELDACWAEAYTPAELLGFRSLPADALRSKRLSPSLCLAVLRREPGWLHHPAGVAGRLAQGCG